VTTNDRLKHASAEPRAQWIRANSARYFAYFQREPRFAAQAIWRQSLRLGIGTAIFLTIVAATMTAIDARAVTLARSLPEWLIEIFDFVTDFGKSFWFLVPVAFALAAIGLFASPALPRMSQRVLAAIAVRLGFLLLAIGLPAQCWRREADRGAPAVVEKRGPLQLPADGLGVNTPASRQVIRSTHSLRPAISCPGRGLAFHVDYASSSPLAGSVLGHFPSDVMAGAVVGSSASAGRRDWFSRRAGSPSCSARMAQFDLCPGASFARIKGLPSSMAPPRRPGMRGHIAPHSNISG
jgi:undecaprenyl-diphosphatase